MEEFEFEGSWWLPETPEARVPGTLGFSTVSGASLDLPGSLKDPGDHFAALERELTEPERILGFSAKGRAVTLWGCFERRKRVNLGGFTRTSFHADVVVVGAHLDNAEDTRFTKMSAEYRHLDEWAGISGLTITMPEDRAAHPMVIEQRRPNPVSASVAGARVTVEVRATLRDDSLGPSGEAAIKERTLLSVEYPEGKRFGEWSGTLHRLRNFLTLGVGSSVEPLAVRAETDGDDSVEIHYRPAGARGEAPSGRNVHRAEMLFTLRDVREDFGRFLGNWFGKAERLGPVYDLYFATAYGSPAYLDDRFLSLVQGVEAYHRRALAEPELPEEEHERRVEEVVSAAPDAHRAWLRGRLAYSNEPGLRKRLAEIMRRDPEAMKSIFGTNSRKRDGFMHKVVETRNYLTHYDEGKKEAAATGRELYELTERLKSVLEACLLREVGFEGDRLKEVLSRKRQFA
jgi:hypothetical protein